MRSSKGPRLVPVEPVAAAEVEQWITALNTRAIPCFVRYTRCYFRSGRRLLAPDREGIDAVLPEVTRYLAILEQVAIQPTGLVRGNFSLADLALLPILDYLTGLEETRPFLTDTRLAAYIAVHRRRPSFVATVPPDA